MMRLCITRVLTATLNLWMMIGAAFAGADAAAGVDPTFPGEHWQTKRPDEVGLDQTRLDAAARLAGGRGCVVRYGYLVYIWGDHTKASDVASACKPFYSHLLFEAIEDGKLAGPDEKVIRWQPVLGGLNRSLGYKDRQMTFRHLAYQTACLGFEEAPGTAYDYNDATMGFFWDTLVNKVYGVEWKDAYAKLFGPKFVEPLQMEDGFGFPTSGPKAGRPGISPRDFARFGLLYLNEGRWRDRQILASELARKAVSEPLPLSIPRTRARPAETCHPRSIGGGGNQCDHNGGYSWLWWLNRPARDGKHWFVDAPHDMFMALGHGGRRGVAVMPGLQLIVSWNDAKELHVDRELGNRVLGAFSRAAGRR